MLLRERESLLVGFQSGVGASEAQLAEKVTSSSQLVGQWAMHMEAAAADDDLRCHDQ